MLLDGPVIGHGNKVGAGNIDRLNAVGDSERLQADVAPARMAAKTDEAVVDDGVLAASNGHYAGHPVLAVEPHAAECCRGMVLNPDGRRVRDRRAKNDGQGISAVAVNLHELVMRDVDPRVQIEAIGNVDEA